MTRTPLRPLARILQVRAAGGNPDLIEQENLAQRHAAQREAVRGGSLLRIWVLGVLFVSGYGLIGLEMASLAASSPVEPRAVHGGAGLAASRADIVDRNGQILATNLATHALYIETRHLVDPILVSRKLAALFPDLDEATLLRRMTDGRDFLWVRKTLSPEQVQAVHEIGDPGLMFGAREMRLYPNGHLAAHVLGGASFGAEGVTSAEVIGTAGIEKAMDARLRDPARANDPLQLSLDLTVQTTVEEVLGTGISMLSAKGGAAILMHVQSGEILALAAGPSFDPNNRPPNPTSGAPDDSPLFNRAVQGIYELGSTFKIFAAAQAMDLGLVGPDTKVDADAPMVWGKYKIKEFENKNYGPLLSVSDVIAKSSNVGTAHIALMIGAERQQAFYKSLGLFDPSPVELIEATNAKPLRPDRWSEIVTITASYGHGVSGSPMNLAAAYATLANGGRLVKPTLLHQEAPYIGPRVVGEAAAQAALNMLRRVVTDGTATMANVDGYEVGGKTGTADKVRKGGGYYDDKVVNTFAAVFPISRPEYVLVVTLDEPVETSGAKPKRTAGWTAVPVAAEIIRRTAPLLGLRPMVELAGQDAIVAVKQ
jgi:cell division protein FtsI (penicillin-binding protein 3)